MIEYVEEGILSGRPYELLYVVHDKDIYPHVVSHEIVQLILHCHRIDILSLEFVARHIEHHQVREALMDFQAYCLSEVGLSESGTSENEKRIERGFARHLGN